MSIDDYWECSDPTLFWAYRTSFNLREKRQQEIDNINAWLSGMYIFDAVNKVIFNSFCRNNENEPTENYLEEPINFKDIEGQQKRLQAKKQRIALENRIKAMTSNVKVTNNRKE